MGPVTGANVAVNHDGHPRLTQTPLHEAQGFVLPLCIASVKSWFEMTLMKPRSKDSGKESHCFSLCFTYRVDT